MIRLNLSVSGDRCGLRAEGHSGLAPRGQDIVCAGVSALVFGFLACAQELEEQGKIRVTEKCLAPGYANFIFFDGNGEALAAVRMLLLGARQIEKAYPQYLQVIDKEE